MQWRNSVCGSAERSMTEASTVIYIVDDDISVREALEALIHEAGWHPKTFSSAQDFLRYDRPRTPGCLILDVSLPDLSGLELQTQLTAEKFDLPIIFITGFGDVPMTVRAMKAGAVEFLTKPFGDEDLLRSVRSAVQASSETLGNSAELLRLRDRRATLSKREKEVMDLVVMGLMNKQVAGKLDISEITVKAHRGKAMKKMGVRTFADLVKVSERLGEGS